MEQLINDLKVKIIETLNLEGVAPDDIDEDNQLVGGELDIDSIIIIELVAQTASVCIGYKELKKNDEKLGGKGWLVGIKNASFFLDKIALKSRITTFSRINFNFENYTQILGTAKIGSKLIGEVNLQVLRSESGSVLGD